MQASYSQQLDAAIERRASRFPAQPKPGRFALLTTVYIRTDAALFRETADCLQAQSIPFDRWIVLAHGPTTPALDEVLESLERDSRIRVLRHPVNLGIMGGMQLCLAEADTEYVAPMDADDLLTRDALQVMSSEIDRLGSPAFLYSDEDMLVEGVPQSPYWRPDWDPVLNLASSYIWHLCCIRRDAALEAGLYSDGGATWCHDWDSAFRLSQREIPVHVPEVLYHWRQHPASTTNTTAGPSEGSRQSTLHLVQRFVSRLAQPDLYEIADFPIFRGAPEWYVFRRPLRSAPVAIIGLDTEHEPACVAPAARRLRLAPRARRAWLSRLWPSLFPAEPSVGDLLERLAETREPHVLLLGPGVEPAGDGWWWEAVKLFECHPEVAMVAGWLTDRHGSVLRGLEVLDERGRLVQPQLRRSADEAGPFALWLKPQCVDAAATDFCFVETGLLRETLDSLPANAPLKGLGLRLAERARNTGRLVAGSPLIRAVSSGSLVDGPAETTGALADSILDTAQPVWPSGRRSRLARYG